MNIPTRAAGADAPRRDPQVSPLGNWHRHHGVSQDDLYLRKANERGPHNRFRQRRPSGPRGETDFRGHLPCVHQGSGRRCSSRGSHRQRIRRLTTSWAGAQDRRRQVQLLLAPAPELGAELHGSIVTARVDAPRGPSRATRTARRWPPSAMPWRPASPHTPSERR